MAVEHGYHHILFPGRFTADKVETIHALTRPMGDTVTKVTSCANICKVRKKVNTYKGVTSSAHEICGRARRITSIAFARSLSPSDSGGMRIDETGGISQRKL